MKQSVVSIVLAFTVLYFNLLQVACVPIRVTSGTQVRSSSNSNVHIVKKCFPGMYLKIDCKMYFDCNEDGQFRRNFCDPGMYWNHRDKKCDQIQNVPECLAVYASKPETKSQAEVPPQLRSTFSKATSTTEKTPPAPVSSVSPKTRVFSATEASFPKEELPSSTTVSSVSSSTTRRNVNQLEGEEDDYIDPPNTDWDIDGVLGLDAGSENDIITEETKSTKDVFEKEDPLGVKKVGSKTPVFQPANTDTHGKTCILRGKEKVCSPAESSVLPAVYTNQVFSKQVPSSTEAPLPANTEQTKPSNSNCSHSNATDADVTSTNRVSFDFSLRLGVQDSAIRFVRVIAYYVNFSIIAWRTT